MTPLTTNPTVVIQLDSNGQNIINFASNVAGDLKVVLAENLDDFNNKAAGRPFNTLRPPQPEQVMSMAGSKARYATK
jgi:hypothetical protein